MAHFAEIDSNNVVIRVIVLSNTKLTGYSEPLTIQEANEISILNKLGGNWVQCSYNKNFRGNFAGIDHIYIPEHDIFVPPKPYPSWTLNEAEAKWEAPELYPSDDGNYVWDEENKSWTPKPENI